MISAASWDRQNGVYKVAGGTNSLFFMEHIFGAEIHFFRGKRHMSLPDLQKHCLDRP